MSAKKRSETEDSGHSKRSAKPASGGESRGGAAAGSPPRKQRVGELGRALRSVYDDTLRESVPDEFIDLIGKLN